MPFATYFVYQKKRLLLGVGTELLKLRDCSRIPLSPVQSPRSENADGVWFSFWNSLQGLDCCVQFFQGSRPLCVDLPKTSGIVGPIRVSMHEVSAWFDCRVEVVGVCNITPPRQGYCGNICIVYGSCNVSSGGARCAVGVAFVAKEGM